jgi:hypothetical protein
MVKKALSINFPIERVILSDILPYEIPIVFSNRNYYKFLCDNEVRYKDKKISWVTKDDALENLIKLILGIKISKPTTQNQLPSKNVSFIEVDKSEAHTVPFVFSTTHKKDQLRQLALMHPKGQLLVVDFYDEFKDLLIYYSGRSDFSLRSPKRVAGCTYIDPRSQIELNDKGDTLLELEGENYENLRSFFVYERFSNVFKFYESKEHLQCEREFNYLAKYDVASCFDSIYTHSIAWAIFGKEFTKKNLKFVLDSFPGKFDSLMQKLNYNETNGILIGPEVSRIFAELILQAIDLNICESLLKKGYTPEKDFKIYRYVDDFFVFYNDEEVRHQIKMILQESLKFYKLSLNKGKEETLGRPIITSISIAKKKISDLLDESLKYEISETIEEGEELPRAEIYIGKSSLITEFKSILATSGVEYGEILNYSLSIIERKIGTITSTYQKIHKSDGLDKSLTRSFESLLGFVFFIYAVSPKVNTTIKLSRICQRLLSFYRENPIGLNYLSTISQVISEECRKVIDQNQNGKTAQIEIMYLLVLMRQLGKYYRIDEQSLAKCFGFKIERDGKYHMESTLDYFSIVTLLFYIEKKVRYKGLLAAIQTHIVDKFEEKKDYLVGDSEMTHLALDLIACPYIEEKLKIEILKYYGIPSNNLTRIKGYRKNWFTTWEDFDLSKELDAKVSKEVY